MRRTWVLLAMAAVLAGCGREEPAKSVPPPTATVDSGLSPPLRVSLERAGPIDAVLTVPGTVPAPGKEPQIPIVKGIGMTFRSPFVRLTESQGRQLRESLVRVGPVQPTDCVFMPDIAFRFGTNADSLRVVLCHGCLEAMVLATGRQGSRYSLQLESDTLLALTAALFPNDARIADYRSQGKRM